MCDSEARAPPGLRFGRISEEAQLLQIREGSPIFIFSRISYIHTGQLVEYVESYYRGDRYKIVQRLRQ